MKPTKGAFYAVMVFLIIATLAPFYPLFLQIWIWSGLGLAIFALADLGLAARVALPEFSRHVTHTLAVGVWTEVKLQLTNRSGRALHMRIHDLYPRAVKVTHMPWQTTLRPESETSRTYRILPHIRGTFIFAAAHVQIRSPLGLWWRVVKLGTESEIRVYPNFQDVVKYSLLATSKRLSQLGIHKRRRRGEGQEYHQMRDYEVGDSMRQIDWKASARMRKLISREFQDARDQHILFLLDVGHTMRAKDGLIGHFDHALNAVLLLTHVALQHGDAVGMMTFSGTSRKLAPRKGKAQMNRLLEAVYDIQPSLETSDYLRIARELLAFQRKRCLVVWVTNVRDEDSEELALAIQMLRRRHLVLLTSMKEQILSEVLQQPVHDFPDALLVSGIHAYLKDRARSLDLLAARGIYTLDVKPEELPIGMINRYLEIKGKGVL